MQKRNKELLVGFVSGIFLPLLFIILFVYFRYNGETAIWSVIKELFRVRALSALLAVGAVPNLLILLFAMNRERWQLGRGVIAATLFYAVAVMIVKFV